MSFTVSSREFTDAIKFVTSVTPRTCAEALNRGGLVAIIGGKGVKGAMQLTPKADKAKITAIPESELVGFVVNQMKKKGEKITRNTLAVAVRKERNRRKRAAGYTAYAGWSNAAKAFGGRGVRGVTPSTKKLAKYGSGKRASSNDLVAELTNTAPASEAIGIPALEQGLRNSAVDMVANGTKKLQQEMDKVNAR